MKSYNFDDYILVMLEDSIVISTLISIDLLGPMVTVVGSHGQN